MGRSANLRRTPLFGVLTYRCTKNASKETRTKVFKYSVLVLTFITYCSYHLSRKPISVVEPVLNNSSHYCKEVKDSDNGTEEVDCSWKPFGGDNYESLVGGLDYVYLSAYAFGMFFSGHIAERVDLRYFLFAGTTLSGIFTALFGCGYWWDIHSYLYYMAVQLFAGLFQSTGWPSVVACMGNWYGYGKRGLILGLWNSHTSVGNILGSVVAGMFVDSDWALSFVVPGGIIFGVGILLFFTLVPYPEYVDCDNPEHATRAETMQQKETAVAQVQS